MVEPFSHEGSDAHVPRYGAVAEEDVALFGCRQRVERLSCPTDRGVAPETELPPTSACAIR